MKPEPAVFRGFMADARGTTAIEFALVALPFLGIIFVLLQMCLMFFWTQSVEQATLMASRAIRAGTVQTTGLTAKQFKEQTFCPNLTAGLDCSSAVVSVSRVPKTWASNHTGGVYTFIDMSGPSLIAPVIEDGKATFCPGDPGDTILLDVTYKAPLLVAWAWPASATVTVNGQSVLLIRATAMVLNEPFQSSKVSAC